MTFQFKIQLKNVDNPKVWRRVLVPEHFFFMDFHEVIQNAFGWENSHLFQFSPKGYGSEPQISVPNDEDWDNVTDANDVPLSEIFTKVKQKYVYIYDFGDDWIHDIVLEKIVDADAEKVSCIAGAGACPPEDCGGSYGYAELKKILADKTHPEYEEMKEWLGLEDDEEWDPAYFNIDAVNENIGFDEEGYHNPFDDDFDDDDEEDDIMDGKDPALFRDYTFISHDKLDKKYGLNPVLWKIIDNKNQQIQSGRSQVIKELEELSKQYPAIPHFKNLLAVALKKQGNRKRFLEIVKQNISDFPDYVVSRCNLANEYIEDRQLDKAQELLGPDFDLGKLYPQRNNEFNEVEIYNYHVAAFIYLIEVRNDNEAQKHLEYLEAYFPERANSDNLIFRLIGLRMERMNAKSHEANKKRRTVKVIPEYVEPADQPPVLTHPELDILYISDHCVSRASLHQIMALPRETLIHDLEKILIDSIARYDQFRELNWNEKTHSFPLHALFILSALEAEEALPTFFTLLRQKEELLDFWFSDIVTEDFWHFAYSMGQHHLSQLKVFILEPNHDAYARAVISSAVLQVALHQKDGKYKAIQWFEDTIKYLIDHKDDTNVFDTTLFSFLVSDLIDIGDKKQWPLIEQCYAEDLVSEMDCCSFEEAKKDLVKPVSEYQIREIHETVDQFYDDWASWSKNYQSDSGFGSPQNMTSYPSPMPFTVPNKVGRNDPCPCGSGKKYKKCCGVDN